MINLKVHLNVFKNIKCKNMNNYLFCIEIYFVGFQKNALYKATTVQTCHENTNTQLHFIKTIGVADLYQSIFQDFLINLLAFVLMFAYLSLAI